jgi:uncharacterized membrane protein YedE/YeeE
LLHNQLPWFVAGPALGLCVVAVRLLLNGRLGVTGAFSEVIERVGRRSLALDWPGWLFVGIVVGAVLFALVAGGPDFHGYGWLTQWLHGSRRILIVPILLVAGVLVGYGAKTAGGCTSGNGLCGTSLLSPASLVATATFFATAIVVTFATQALL